MDKKVNISIKKFINKLIEKDYKNAHVNLSNIINDKIKRQMINNNTNLF